jgi:NAD(P)-dependent dehydrogenase (short-subunit alcohol dehydrogenase family)
MTTSDLFDISGKVALINGATGALGSAVSHGLASAGAKVMLTGRSEHKLKQLADAITESGCIADYAAGKPDDPEAVREVADAAVDRFGGIDVLVTAAGMNKPAPIVDQPPDEWQEIVDSQLKTTWLFCQAVGQVMIGQNRGGKVILIGSQRGDLGMANYSAYSPAKAAVHLLAKTLGCEWGPYNIQVNCLAPGLFRSELTDWMWGDEAAYKRLLTRVPHGRLGEPQDFVGPVIFLASAASDWMTGAVLAVDGGYTAG